MNTFHFPGRFLHNHPPVKNAQELFEQQLTLGQRAADRVVRIAGSWRFILIQSALLALWVLLNVLAFIRHWDPYPSSS